MQQNGSSETIRKTTFNFENFFIHHTGNVPTSFFKWFVGFFKGHQSLSFDDHTDVINFVINQKEKRILSQIRSTLGFGQVTGPYQNKAENKYFRYVVISKENVDKILHILNGNLLLCKTNKRLISLLGTRNERSRKIIWYLGRLESIDYTKTAWLSGYTDAEGCFFILKQNDPRYKIGYRVRCKFILDQSEELEILEDIKQRFFFRNGNIEVCKETKNIMHRYVCTSLKHFQDPAVKYFKHFPLRTTKQIAFVRFTKILGYMRKNVPWEGKVLERIEKLLLKLKIEST